ncbi:hypothetical protein [Sphingobacterium spiritivorum]|uniref:hypothetical protein n=1 Tax=Sphingobacterium spiritivorum TaxID=258 RepID=UPI003DA43B10
MAANATVENKQRAEPLFNGEHFVVKGSVAVIETLHFRKAKPFNRAVQKAVFQGKARLKLFTGLHSDNKGYDRPDDNLWFSHLLLFLFITYQFGIFCKRRHL